MTSIESTLIDLTDPAAEGEPPVGTMMTIPQVAERLGIGVRYVRRLVAERRIPFYKVGYLIRFERGEVETWLAAGRVEGAR